jgi:hypothetical protein
MPQKFLISESQLNRITESENKDLKDIVTKNFSKNPDEFINNLVDDIPPLEKHKKQLKSKIVDLLSQNIEKVSIIGLLVLWMSVYIPYILKKNKIEKETPIKVQTTTKVDDKEKTILPKGWTYDTSFNKMDEKTTFATIKSDNQVDLDFPYNGGTFAEVAIRTRGGKKEVLILVNKGQIDTDYDGTYFRVKFDDEKPYQLLMSEPESGSSNLMFVEYPSNFIKKITRHKKLVIEIPFFQMGRQQFIFNISDLKL